MFSNANNFHDLLEGRALILCHLFLAKIYYKYLGQLVWALLSLLFRTLQLVQIAAPKQLSSDLCSSTCTGTGQEEARGEGPCPCTPPQVSCWAFAAPPCQAAAQTCWSHCKLSPQFLQAKNQDLKSF